MAAPKSFTQSAHPVRNLGQFAHPPAQSAHRTKNVPHPPKSDRFSFNGALDYKPDGAPKQNKRFDIAVPANKNVMDASDAKSETQAPAMAAAFAGSVGSGYQARPKAKKLPKPKSGLDYFGKL